MPDFATLLAPIGTGASGAITDALPIAIPVFVFLVGLALSKRVMGKFGVRG